MNLIVATRIEDLHLRMEASGRWQYGDALKLAYMAKAAGLRTGRHRFLFDLRAVTATPDSEELFLICERLERIFTAPTRIALVASAELIDTPQAASTDVAGSAAIARFAREGLALDWLLPPPAP